jgi:hypothetical protein
MGSTHLSNNQERCYNQFISNFRELNKRIKQKPYPIPKIQDLLLNPEGFSMLRHLILIWDITILSCHPLVNICVLIGAKCWVLVFFVGGWCKSDKLKHSLTVMLSMDSSWQDSSISESLSEWWCWCGCLNMSCINCWTCFMTISWSSFCSFCFVLAGGMKGSSFCQPLCFGRIVQFAKIIKLKIQNKFLITTKEGI